MITIPQINTESSPRVIIAQRGISIFSGAGSSSGISAFRQNLQRPGMSTPASMGGLEPSLGGFLSGSSISGIIQRRFKSRGNTYQPSTLRRKRKFGFLARLRSRYGKKILDRRREKGRWYLTH